MQRERYCWERWLFGHAITVTLRGRAWLRSALVIVLERTATPLGIQISDLLFGRFYPSRYFDGRHAHSKPPY